KLNAGDYRGAARGLLDWNKPPEIMGRRKSEHTLFTTGAYSNNGMFSVYPANRNGVVQWAAGKRVRASEAMSPAKPLAAQPPMPAAKPAPKPVAPAVVAPAPMPPPKPVTPPVQAPVASVPWWKRLVAALKG
ncbi:MAG: hypothetical protein ACRDBH_12630, partial [Bosea sp. (in: a-proteobacteria)]